MASVHGGASGHVRPRLRREARSGFGVRRDGPREGGAEALREALARTRRQRHETDAHRGRHHEAAVRFRPVALGAPPRVERALPGEEHAGVAAGEADDGQDAIRRPRRLRRLHLLHRLPERAALRDGPAPLALPAKRLLPRGRRPDASGHAQVRLQALPVHRREDLFGVRRLFGGSLGGGAARLRVQAHRVRERSPRRGRGLHGGDSASSRAPPRAAYVSAVPPV